jgi:hypothetical protein
MDSAQETFSMRNILMIDISSPIHTQMVMPQAHST